MEPLPILPEPPPGLRFHPGHTWVDPGEETATAGIDGFAARLLPRATAVELPAEGRRLRQGEIVLCIRAGDRTARFLAPVGGRVVAVNRRLEREPELVLVDPYGAGWIVKLRPQRLAADLRNLLGGTLALRWLEAAAEDLRVRAAGLAGSVLQRAGGGAAGFLACLPATLWEEVVAETLHSAPEAA